MGSGEVDRESTQPNEVRIATPASSPKTKKRELRVTGNGRSCGNVGLGTFFPKRITNRLAPHGDDGHE